jgi:hypothetical protein
MSSVSQIYLAEISDTKRRLVLAKKRKTIKFLSYFSNQNYFKKERTTVTNYSYIFFFFLEEQNKLSISRETFQFGIFTKSIEMVF